MNRLKAQGDNAGWLSGSYLVSPPYGDTTLFVTGIWPRAGLSQTALATALAGIGDAGRSRPLGDGYCARLNAAVATPIAISALPPRRENQAKTDGFAILVRSLSAKSAYARALIAANPTKVTTKIAN